MNELRGRAEDLVKRRNHPETKEVYAGNVYKDFLGGVLVDVTFLNEAGEKAINHVVFPEDNAEPIVNVTFSDVCEFVSHYKERQVFFRFLEFTGIDGLIALVLTIMFIALLFVLAISGHTDVSTILEIIKMSLTIILGYFFGRHASKSD